MSWFAAARIFIGIQCKGFEMMQAYIPAKNGFPAIKVQNVMKPIAVLIFLLTSHFRHSEKRGGVWLSKIIGPSALKLVSLFCENEKNRKSLGKPFG